MTEHSVIGPSSLHRLLNCPGSLRQSAARSGGQSSKSSGAAAEGTVAHSLVEAELSDAAVMEAPGEGTVVNEDGHSILVDSEMIDGVGQMVSFCEPLKEGAHACWVEARMDLGELWGGKPPESIFGTVDFAAYWKEEDTLYVVDFKYGRMPVNPRDNPQALAYSLGACFALGVWPSNIVNVIIQPRGMDGAPPVKVARLSGLDLIMWSQETLKPGVDRLFEDDAMLSPGDWCTFCPGKIDCPALYEIARQKSRAEFGQLPQSPTKLDDADIGDVLDWVSVLEMWIREVRAECSGRIEKGHDVPGWKLVPKRAVRKWDNLEGMPVGELPKDFFTKKLKSPAQIEKLSPEVYSSLEKQGFVAKASSGSTLAPDHDPREKVATVTAKDEFGEI